jgi:hypothetical protein
MPHELKVDMKNAIKTFIGKGNFALADSLNAGSG